MKREKVWWRVFSEIVRGEYVQLPKGAVILGCQHIYGEHEEIGEVYVDYMLPVTEAEMKVIEHMFDYTKPDLVPTEASAKASFEADKAVAAERREAGEPGYSRE